MSDGLRRQLQEPERQQLFLRLTVLLGRLFFQVPDLLCRQLPEQNGGFGAGQRPLHVLLLRLLLQMFRLEL